MFDCNLKTFCSSFIQEVTQCMQHTQLYSHTHTRSCSGTCKCTCMQFKEPQHIPDALQYNDSNWLSNKNSNTCTLQLLKIINRIIIYSSCMQSYIHVCNHYNNRHCDKSCLPGGIDAASSSKCKNECRNVFEHFLSHTISCKF